MEHKGLVSRVAEQLERTIALGQWPKNRLPSEREMAKRYGVSRTTIRGALQGLAARGLIVQHPGRKSRTVELGEALSLESLKLVLPEGRTDLDRRKLLEGFFALKREVTVELLAASCEHAPQQDVDLLLDAAFALRDDARWKEERRDWVQREFNLLQLAARAADKPGHTLLILSLEKAFWSMADSLLPALPAEALQHWAMFVFNAVHDRDAQALRRELPALLKAVDEPVLNHLAPVRETSVATEPTPAPMEEPVSGETATNRYACHTSSLQLPTTGAPPPLTESTDSDSTSDPDPLPASRSLPSPRAQSEVQASSRDPRQLQGSTRAASSSAAPLDEWSPPPTLLMALAPFSSSEDHGPVATETPSHACAEAAVPLEPGAGSRGGADPEPADSLSWTVVRAPGSSG